MSANTSSRAQAQLKQNTALPTTSASAQGMSSGINMVAFEHGAAGHEGISTDASGSLLIKPCTQAEIDFYESAKSHLQFQAHMPTFMGSLTLNQDPAVEALKPVLQEQGVVSANSAPSQKNDTSAHGKAGQDWTPSGGKKLATGLAIVLENAAAGFKRPCVLDLKLGARLWDDDAPETKRQKLDEVSRDTTSGSLGFRVAGMKIWLGGDGEGKVVSKAESSIGINTSVKDGYKSFDKNYGRGLDEKDVSSAFSRFLGGYNQTKSTFNRKRGRLLAKRLLREVQSIQFALEEEESRMYSASILMVVEGDDDALDKALAFETENSLKEKERQQRNGQMEEEDDDMDDDDEGEKEEMPKIQNVFLIDFAHAHWTPGKGPDENALNGVRNIVKIFEEVISLDASSS